ncbi:MAG: FAD-dependent oxidoreductase, partial [Jiangellaceae bacterium]
MPGLTHPRTAAIVGAGPAGLNLLAALLKAETFEQIDVYESAPAPFGLVRYGVAPDHPKTRGIARVLAAGFGSARARLLGNVHVGVDVTLDELRSGYDAVVFASGMRGDRRLVIPGEDLDGSFGASELVDWYTGHPEAGPIELPVGLRSAAVIGAGNVALDVARLLTRDPKSLHTTSMPRHVVDVLTASTLTDVHLIARRGPAFARFTSPELHEIGDLEGVDVVADPADVVLDDADRAELERHRQGKVTVKVLGEWLDRQPGDASRRIHFHFWRRPVRILGSDQVNGVELAPTRGEGEPLTIPVE